MSAAWFPGVSVQEDVQPSCSSFYAIPKNSG